MAKIINQMIDQIKELKSIRLKTYQFQKTFKTNDLMN